MLKVIFYESYENTRDIPFFLNLWSFPFISVDSSLLFGSSHIVKPFFFFFPPSVHSNFTPLIKQSKNLVQFSKFVLVFCSVLFGWLRIFKFCL